MIHALSPLWAADAIHTTFELGRIQSNADWILPIVAFIAVLLLRVLHVSPRFGRTEARIGVGC